MIECAKWNNTTTFNSDYAGSLPAATFMGGGCYWLQFKDDGTTRFFNASTDGVNWVTILTTSHTDWITPTHVGFYVDANSNSNACGMNGG